MFSAGKTGKKDGPSRVIPAMVEQIVSRWIWSLAHEGIVRSKNALIEVLGGTAADHRPFPQEGFVFSSCEFWNNKRD